MPVTANRIRNKAQELQRALYLAAKRSTGRRFHALYDKVYREDILAGAWAEVKANRGAPGVDGVTIADIEARGEAEFLAELSAELKAHRYRPRPVRRVYIPKPGRPNERRPLGVPTLRDRVVQQAVKIVLEPIFEADFRDSSYGFRPKRSAHQALEKVRVSMNAGAQWAVDVDVRSFFDEIGHDVVLRLVQKRISDRQVVKLIGAWLRAGVMEEGEVNETTTGTPQGGVISPLLANIVLHVLDSVWEKRCGHLGVLVRYADDLVVLCRSEAAARESLRRIGVVMEHLGLRLHPEKTRIVDAHLGKEGFDFLGFHHRMRKSWHWRGHWYVNKWPSTRAMKAVREKVKEVLGQPSARSRTIGEQTRQINRILKGWGAYFRVGNSAWCFAQIDTYVRYRFAKWDQHKHQRSNVGWRGPRIPQLLQAVGLYRLNGTVRYYSTAHATR
jgi:group II intron reverse transcriptase/maturase